MSRRLYSPFWVVVTMVLTIVFVVLAAPLLVSKLGIIGGGLATLGGVLVICANYLVRAYIFSHPRFSGSGNDKDKAAL